MHGRLKVKTPAEQQEAKKLERAKKVAKYKEGMAQIVALRGQDDAASTKTVMEISGLLLSANSDLYSLWNVRKEIFKRMEETKEEEELQSLYTSELDFIEASLVKNPKSYSLWEHRVFCMRRAPDPDWSRELRLTTKFLEYDERNFHCWDYRRFVVSASPKSASAADELSFTFEKISHNFSNYSSWHYRSRLLPLVHPDPDCLHGIKESALLQEFSHTMNAVFTDPNDQSAWFYHRWLLGRKDRPMEVDLISVARPREDPRLAGQGVVVFSKPVRVGDTVELKVCLDGVAVPSKDLNFKTPFANQHSSLWVFDLPSPLLVQDGVAHEISIETDFVASAQGAQSSLTLPPDFDVVTYRRYQETLQGKTTLFRHELSASQNEILVAEMESCQQLLELEPGNKWTLLTLVHLMRALDPAGHQASILSYIDELLTVDPSREGFYLDFRSKYLFENVVEGLPVRGEVTKEVTKEGGDGSPLAPSSCVSLASCGLTSVHHAQYLSGSPSLDLARNRISNVESLALLQNIRQLSLSSNCIDSCCGLESLTMLCQLDLTHNRIESLSALAPLRGCVNLQKLFLSGNPVVASEKTEVQLWLKTNLPNVECLI